MLAALPGAGFRDAPAMLARVAAEGGHFLFTAELPGAHPDARRHPLDARQLRALLDGLCAMDCRALVHYDLKAANILVDGERARFIDFEFARFEDVASVFAAGGAGQRADFNYCGNPFYPVRSNVANFEFRALHRYLRDLAATRGEEAAEALHIQWLRGRSDYHARFAEHLAALAVSSAAEFAGASGIGIDDARARLRAAARYEELLSVLCARPHPVTARVERLVTAYRHAVFWREADEARRLAAATRAMIDTAARGPEALPDAYRTATLATLDLVGRSTHPPR